MNANTNPHYSYRQTWKIWILVLTLILIVTKYSFTQEAIQIPNKKSVYKNSIKGFAYALPFFGASISLGYERNLSKHSVIELGAYYRYFVDEMHLKYHSICIMPAYKYYTASDVKILNNFWVSIYLSYLYETHTHHESEDNIRCSLYYYGFGGSLGKRIYLNHKAFLDIGFGVSYNYYSDKSIFSTIDGWSNMLLYRPIIQFGWKF